MSEYLVKLLKLHANETQSTRGGHLSSVRGYLLENN